MHECYVSIVYVYTLVNAFQQNAGLGLYRRIQCLKTELCTVCYE